MFAERLDRARAAMVERGVDVALFSLGADLPYFTGYEAMPLERLTMLVLPNDGDATLVVPRLEAPRVLARPEAFAVRAWDETEDPVAIVAGLAGSPRVAAIGDRTWARFLVDLQVELPSTSWLRASEVTSPLRSVKDTAEVESLRRASAAADRVAVALQAGDVALVGRTEAEVSAELGQRLVAEGHHRVNFAIVAAGANAASPHHEPGPRVIEAGEVVLCDFGGTMPDGYCSDITRCVHTGPVPNELAELYAVLAEAQVAAVAAAVVGATCEEVDAVARLRIAEAGWGEHFIHRTGHGIGLEEHEEPYLVAGNTAPLVAGHAFSVEPGIYLAGRTGARIEDIVVATDAGPDPLNRVDHDLVVVEA
ncbi:MAG: Xaa-Pro peptidase family protein [Actinomycetota bacterium]|nr:Xaa-Pro peptidase family protein [Actinomycetota bacterium]